MSATTTAPPSVRPPHRWEVAAGRRLHVALVAAAALCALTSSGDVFLLAGLLGLVAADVLTAGTAALVAVSVIVRFGTTSLPAVAGAQAVLGPAALTGHAFSASAMVLAGLALVLASPRGLPVIAFGLSGAALAAGPAPGGPLDLAIRAAGAVIGVALAWGAARYLPRRWVHRVSLGVAALSLALVAAGRALG